MLSQKVQADVYNLLSQLANVCDNAETKDGQGFSRSDLIGHYIVEMPTEYFDKNWQIVALQLVIKYKSQLNIDSTPYKKLLSSICPDTLKEVKTTRKERVKRRILLEDNGDFELYFPTKTSMKGFCRILAGKVDWMKEKEIPHGYAFVVKRGAREFVLRTMNKFTNWFIPDDVLLAINEEIDNPIDVSEGVDYQLYITGDSIENNLFLSFKYNGDIVTFIKNFSDRKFSNNPLGWDVSIKNIDDLNLLRELTEEFDSHLSPELKKELKKDNSTVEKLKKVFADKSIRDKKREHENRPISVVQLSENKKSFIISFTHFSYDFVDFIKSSLIEKSYQGGVEKNWLVKINNHNVEQLAGKFSDDNWEFDLDCKEYIELTFAKAKVEIELESKHKEIAFALSSAEEVTDLFEPDLSLIKGSLLPFQPVVIEYSTIRKNMLIGDDMGLGKSLSALACAVYHNLHDSVNIVCPAIARLTWRNEILKWLPPTEIYIAKKANSKKNAKKERELIQSAKFVICSYNKLSVYEDELALREAKLFIGDESQYIKRNTSQRYKSAHKISDTCDRVYLLSGTPLTNRPRELITQLDMLRVLDSHFDGAKAFLFRYCGASHNGFGWDFTGSSELSELRKKLRESCMIRRKKDDVLKFLPKKRRMRIPVELSNRKKYDDANKNFVKHIQLKLQIEAKKLVEKQSIPKKEQKEFIENFIKEGAERAGKAEIFTHINMLRGIVGEGLISSAIEWIESFCNSGNPLVVFAYHKDEQRALYNELKKKTGLRVGHIFSSDSDEAKKKTEEDFQNGLLDVVVCSQLGANTNITLTAATTVFTLEYTWVPGDHLQAEDRCRRIGTSENAESIDCYYLHATETIDDHFWGIISSKFEVIDNTLDTDDSEGFENIDDETKGFIINAMMQEFDFINGQVV